MKKEEAKTTNGALPSGTVLKEHYRIEEVLGRGGFGIAYKAVDESLQVVVAIKEYVYEKIPKEDRGRKEAQIAATKKPADKKDNKKEYAGNLDQLLQ